MFTPTLRWNSSYRTFDQFQRACCTPSPETSRVMDGLSDLEKSCRFHRCRQSRAALSVRRIALLQQLLNDVFNVFAHITASVSVVASAMVNGTSSRRASFQPAAFYRNRSDRSAECYFCQLDTIAGIAVAQTFVVVVYPTASTFFACSWPIT